MVMSLVFTGCSVLIGIFLTIRDIEFKRNAVLVSGTVVGRIASTDDEGATNYYLRVQYYVDGMSYEGSLSVGWLDYNKYKDGEQIPFYYNALNCSQIRRTKSRVFGVFWLVVSSITFLFMLIAGFNMA